MILETVAHKLQIARYEADEDASPLDLTTAGDFANKPAKNGTTFLGAFNVNKGLTNEMKVNGIRFMFCGGSAAGKTFTYKIFNWQCENGPAKQIAEGTGTLGTQAVVKYPHNGITATNKFWADTLTVTWYNWIKRVDSSDTTGHNTVAEVWCDTGGVPWWYIEIADADGSTGDEAGNIAAYYCYY